MTVSKIVCFNAFITIAALSVLIANGELTECTNFLCRNATDNKNAIFHSFFAGEPLNNTYMNSTSFLQNITVKQEALCIKECTIFAECFSVNVGPVDKAFECQLFAENKYSNASLLIKKQNWKHISLKNSGCDINNCLNGGTCIPLYQDDSSKCECSKFFEGAYCENEIYDPTSEFLFTDGVFTNTGSTATPHFTTASNSISKFDYERNSTVLNCLGTKKCVTSATATVANAESLCILTPQVGCADGFTFMFWFKLVRNQEFQDNKGFYILSTGAKYTGLEIKFNMTGKWMLEAGVKSEIEYQYKVAEFEDYDDFPFRWHHIAITWSNPLNLKIYVDGFERVADFNVLAEQRTLSPSKQPIMWMNSDSQMTLYPRFDIDELKIWIREFDAAQIYNRFVKDRIPNLR